LGDARAASKRFRQAYLTTQEISELEADITSARRYNPKTWWLMFLVCLVLLCTYPADLLVVVLIYAVLGIAAHALAQHKPTLSILRQISLYRTANKLNLQLYLLLFFVIAFIRVGPGLRDDVPYLPLFFKVAYGVAVVVALLSMIATCRQDSLLRKKLRSASENDLPPSGPTTA
jgi:hypothetical protein